MSTLTQFGGGTTVGSIVPGLYPGNSRFLPCDGVSTTPVTSANSSLAKVYPLVTSSTGTYFTSTYYGFHAYGIAYGAGIWVAVGAGSSGSSETDTPYCLTSSDLVNWVPRPLPNNAVWRSITWTGGRFIAVGSDASLNGYSAYSVDGLNWASGNIPTSVQYRWIVSSGGRAFAMASAGGTTYYSDDGAGWTNSGTTGVSVLAIGSFKGRAYVTNGGTVNMKFTGGQLTSGWSTVYTGSSLNSFAASPTTMVISSGAAGQTVTTTDGLNFTTQAGAPAMYSVMWDGTNFIGFSNTSIYTSPTGVTWTIRTTDIFLNTSIRFVGASDGTTLAWVDTASGNQHFSFSTNSGVNVAQRPFPKSGFMSTGNYAPIAYSSTLGLYVMGGMSDTSYEPVPVMMTSTDGITWTERALEMPAYNTLSGASVQQIVWTGSAFIASTSSTGTVIWVSTDGINWRYKSGPIGASTVYLTYGNGRALMMNTSGTYSTSVDNGTTWVSQGSMGLGSVIGVVYNGTNFVAVNSGGAVSTSSTGIGTGWTSQTGLTAATYTQVGVAGTALVVTVSGSVTTMHYNTTNGTGSWTARALPITISSGRISYDGTNAILSSNAGSNSQFVAFSNPAGTLTTVNAPRSIVSASTLTAFYANGNIIIPSYNNANGGALISVFVSSNVGSTWAERSLYAGWNSLMTSMNNTLLSSTVFGGKAYFAARYRPVIWSVEENGTSFRARVLPMGSNTSPAVTCQAVGSNGSIMVAFSYDSTNFRTLISTSTDGNSWTLRTTPAGLPTTLGTGAPTVWTNIVWNGTIFLATSNTFFGMTSTDGITWTLQYLPVQEVVAGGIAYGAGSFFLSSTIPVSSTSTLGYVSYYTSTDGVTWTVKSSPAKYQNSSTAVYFASDGTTVMMMPNSQLSTPSGVQYWTTTDGANWTRGQAYGYGSALTNSRQIVNYGGTFFAGSMASMDGKFWFSTGSDISSPIPMSATTVFGFTGSIQATATIDTNTIKSPALNSTQTFVAPYYATSLVVA